MSADGGDATRSALLGVGVGVLIAVAMVGLSVLAFGSYGTTLFVATPFVMGATAAFVYNARATRSAGATLGVAALSVLAACGVILVLALEGILCLFMAAPPALVMALMGAGSRARDRAVPDRGHARARRDRCCRFP